MAPNAEATSMDTTPAVSCSGCGFHWNSAAMAEGLRLLGSCPKCGGALVFSGELFEVGALLRTVLAAAVFCCASSAMYLVNDLRDVEGDRVHPKKRHRPIAAGLVSPGQAGATTAGRGPLTRPSSRASASTAGTVTAHARTRRTSVVTIRRQT